MATQNDTPILRYVKLTPNALPPKRGSTLAAGLDLQSAYDHTIPAFGKGLVEMDLAILLLPGCYGKIAARSGLALHRHINVGAG
jgi:dUTPase